MPARFAWLPTGLLRLLACTLCLCAATIGHAASMRLPADVRPLAYQLSITLDPSRPLHQGEVAIDVDLARPQHSVQLHAKDLRIRSAWLEHGARRHAAKATPFDAERIELRFAQPVPAGRGRLVLAFEGRLQDKDVYGLFRRREGGDWYAYTQFESTGARLAFPLFDEPGWKVPWQLTLTVPQALMAVANTPVQQDEPAAPGWKRVRFEPTPPLPSYLLAFAVGPFEALDAPPAGRLPIRVLAPRGRAAEGAFAAGVTARIVEALEAYFDLPHPYAKLDSLAVSVPASFGAMEHPGLITYGAPLLLATAEGRNGQFERDHLAIAAHEIAHQWFGNLVTMRWWDDLWLNESFASWMGDRITAQLRPQWQWETSVQQARARAMHTDRLRSSRRIQQPVLSDDDMGDLWDTITYEKGQVVLSMFEQWLGAERFRNGVRRYIHRHAWGSASAEDFLAALGAEDPALPAALRTFISQPGVPRIDVALRCDGDRPRVELRQSRLLPAGAPDTRSRWQVPMQLRSPGGTTRVLLDAAHAEVPLPDTSCPAWVQANAGGMGYYRVRHEPETWRALMTRADLPVPELLAGLDDALALSEAGELPLAELLPVAERWAGHPRRAVTEQVIEVLRRAQPVEEATAPREASARWQRAFGERARTLGWTPREGDTEDERLLRAQLVPMVAELGDDAALRRGALDHVDAWLAGGRPPPSELRAAMLAVAALDGEAALFDRMLMAVRRADDSAQRVELYAALGHFRSPALAHRARELLLAGGTDWHEAGAVILRAQGAVPALRPALLAFLQTRHAELARRMGRDDPAWLPTHLRSACSEDEASRIERVFSRPAPRYQGGRRALAQTLEQVRVCAAWRTHEAARH